MLSRDSLARGDVALGMQVFSGSPVSVEIIGFSGFDFVVIDMEHSSVGVETAAHMIRAAHASGVTPLVRPPSLEPKLVTQLMEAGAAGVHFPGVSSVEDAASAVRAVKYPPNGWRGACPYTRAAGYSELSGWPSHVAKANENSIVSLLIEGATAVDQIDDIVAVPGIDIISVGRVDLAQSMGLDGDGQHPRVNELVERVSDACKRANVAIGSAPPTLERARELRDEGVQFLNMAPDTIWLARQCRAIRESLSPTQGA